MRAADEPVIVEKTYDATIDEVWQVITELRLMREWYFENIPAFEAEVGFETRFSVESGGRTFRHLWKVTEVVPGKKIAYDWRYDGLAGAGAVAFELFEDGQRTRLRLTDTVQEDFPRDIPEFARESCLAGWEYFLGERLGDFLRSR